MNFYINSKLHFSSDKILLKLPNNRCTNSIPNDERNWLDTDTGKFTTISGTRFDGITTHEGVKSIVNSLSEKKIAAYSRVTQVFFQPLNEKDK